MTWYASVARMAWLICPRVALAAFIFLVACAEPAVDYSLTVTSPAADQELSMADDVDSEAAGLQYDVEVKAKGLNTDSTLRLFVGGSEVASAQVGSDHKATFPAVTLPPGYVSVVVQSKTGLVSSSPEHQYVFRQLEIVSPGARVTAADDVNAGLNGIQVQVEGLAHAVTDDVSLWVDGKEVGTATPAVDAGNGLSFEVTLEAGEHTLQLRAGELYSAEHTVLVDEVCGVAQLISPRATSGTEVTLGGQDGTCPKDGPFTTDVEIATTVASGVTAELWVNGQAFGTATVEGAAVMFRDVPLDRRDRANSLAVRFDVDGHECRTDFDLDVLVDCAGPDCTIAGPETFAVTKGGTTTQYLNAASAAAGGGFDIAVESSDEMAGRTVELLVDGDSRNPLSARASEDGDASRALFSAVALGEGAHTVEARCEDAHGNVTYSQRLSWTVDTIACGLEITTPNAGTAYGLADDIDAVASGTQVAVRTTASGEDCQWVRAAACDADTDSLSGDLAAYPTSAEHRVTLDDSRLDQELCVEVLDTAHNASLARVPVQFFHPQIVCGETELLSPAPGGEQIVTLGGASCSDTGPYTTDIELGTGAAEGLSADLFVNGELAGSALVGGGKLRFANIPLERRDRVNTLMVQVHAPTQDCSTSLDVGLMVDCGGHDCSIASPEPLLVDDDGVLTSYLNREHGEGQFDIVVASSAGARGEMIQLIIDGDDSAPLVQTAVAETDGAIATFAAVDLADGVHTVQARCFDAAGDAGYSRRFTWTVDTAGCEVTIDSPLAGATFSASDDAAPFTQGTQVPLLASVVGEGCDRVRTAACEGDVIAEGDWQGYVAGEAVSVTLDDSRVPQALCVEVQDMAGNGETASVPVEFFNPTCGAIALLSPRDSGGSDSVTLGGDDGTCPVSGPYTTTVEVATEAGEGSVAHLYVNGVLAETTQVHTAVATFADVVLDRRDSENRLAVEIEADGQLCQKTFELGVMVDCDGPNCAIASPTPYLVQEGGDTVAYLNLTHGEGEFDVAVETSVDMVGRHVELIVDGNSRNPLSVTALAAGTSATANFADVALEDGEHTLEARCVDAQGNETYSSVSSFMVDTAPCVVEVVQPPAGTTFLLADDVNATAAGTQVNVQATASGNCTAVRAGPCDPEEGLGTTGCSSQLYTCGVTSNSAFEPFVSGQMLSVTLDSAFEQDLCVEVKDAAGNVGIGSTPVEYHSAAPEVAILSPQDGDQFNIDGQSPFLPDEAVTAGCQGTFTVECSAISLPVELVRISSLNQAETVLATETCGDASGISGVTPGYGAAVFAAASFQDPADPAATIVARQSFSGDSGLQTGVSTAIHLDGQCEPLTVTYASSMLDAGSVELGCSGASIGPNAGTLSAEITLDPAVSASASLYFTGPALGAVPQLVASQQSSTGTFTFSAFSAGMDEGDVTFSVEVQDSFGNRGSASCDVNVASVNMTVAAAIADPPNTTTFDPATVNSCLTAGAGSYAVPVLFTLDAESLANASSRLLTYTVDGGDPQTVDIASISLPVCVPVSEGGSTIAAQLSYTLDTATVSSSPLNVTVQSLQLTAPADAAVFMSNDPACSALTGINAQVQAAFAAYYADGTAVDVIVTQDGMDTSFPAQVWSGGLAADGAGSPLCVPVGDGQQTITVLIPSSGATDSVDVSLDPTALSILVTATAPNPASADYRTDPVELSWTLTGGGFTAPDASYNDYRLRCHVRTLDLSGLDETAAAAAATTWWAEANHHLRSDGSSRFVADGAPPTNTGTYDIPTGGQPLHCALRLCNGSNQCTPLTASALVEKPFRETLVSTGVSGLSNLGESVVPVGDVNGDNLADALVTAAFPASSAARSGAVLYLSGPSPRTVPISQTVGGGFAIYAPLGYRAAELGDINGDGRDDFALSFPTANNDEGVVYIFFGRLADDPWPTEVDLDLTACGADICLRPTATALADLGTGVAGVGDFDGDGTNDIVMTAPFAAGFAGESYVLLGEANDVKCTVSPCTGRGGDFFANDRIVTTVGPYRGFVFSGFATDVIAAGKTGGTGDGTDDLLVVLDDGTFTELYRVQGRAYTAGTGLETIAGPVGNLVKSGTFNYNTRVALVGDVWQPDGSPSSMDDMSDLAIHAPSTSYVEILAGDSTLGFSAAVGDVLNLMGAGGSNMGASLCRGELPALAWLGGLNTDLDGDQVPDLCMGGAPIPGSGLADQSVNSVPVTGAYQTGQVFYVVGDLLQGKTPVVDGGGVPRINVYAVDVNAPSVHYPISPSETASDPDDQTGMRVVQVVGDVNGDGSPDLIVGDVPQRTNQRAEVSTGGFDNDGGFWLLY